MILRVKFTKRNYLKYISHLDLVRLFERTFRIIDLAIEYSQGYNPRPRFSLASPLALGVESYGEYMEIELREEIDIDDFIDRMNGELPEDIRILGAEYSRDDKAVGHYVEWADYEISLEVPRKMDRETIISMLDSFKAREDLVIERRKSRKGRTLVWQEDLKTLVRDLKFLGLKDSYLYIEARLKAGEGNLRPEDFMEILAGYLGLDFKKEDLRIVRLGLLGETDGQVHSIFGGVEN